MLHAFLTSTLDRGDTPAALTNPPPPTGKNFQVSTGKVAGFALELDWTGWRTETFLLITSELPRIMLVQ